MGKEVTEGKGHSTLEPPIPNTPISIPTIHNIKVHIKTTYILCQQTLTFWFLIENG